MADFYTTKNVKAAKDHTCEHCRGTIPAGTIYVRASGMYEGQVFSIKAHLFCDATRNTVIELCEIEQGQEMMELPGEITASLSVPGMLEVALRYNEFAKKVGGLILTAPEIETPPGTQT